MGNLPSARVTPSKPFSKIGVDCAGPYSVTPIKTRKSIYYKYYICIFICFSTRSIHLEYLSSMTTDAFLMALFRFIARRGLPQEIYSDCGTNFVGSKRELNELLEYFQHLSNDVQAQQYVTSNHIHWNMNPPFSPPFRRIVGIKFKINEGPHQKNLYRFKIYS